MLLTFQEQMRQMMPQFMQQLQNPAVQSMMTNPEALAAIQQVQDGLQRLHTVAPDLYRTMGMPSVGPGLALNPTPLTAASTTSSTTTTDSATTSGTTASTTTPSATAGGEGLPPSATPEQANAFAQLMSQMVTGMESQGLNNPPEERFSGQLEQLASMGFVDRPANIQGTQEIANQAPLSSHYSQ
jgi:ubiquilin